MGKKYSIGLDIGTNSVGWAVIKDDYDLIKRKMPIQGNTEKKAIKKNFWGVDLFDAGQTAAARRMSRTNRRRLSRRRNRISYLQEIFAPGMNQMDPNFFHRLDESFFVEEDKKFERYPIFGTLEEEKNYYQEYPTIYHLRKELADSKEKKDLRLVYLAIAHIIKYRGHFLIEGKLSSENVDITQTFQAFLKEYNRIFNFDDSSRKVDEVVEVNDIFTQKISRTRKKEKTLSLFEGEKSTGRLGTFLTLIVGNQADLKKVFDLPEKTKLQFSKDDYEEGIENLLAQIGTDYSDLFTAAKNVYDAIELSGILTVEDNNTKARLSASMIKRYDDHKKDLELFKKFIKENLAEKYDEIFKDTTKQGYAGYIENPAKVKQDVFYKYVKKTLEKVEGADYFLEKINREDFLRKQRTFDNGVIPHQIHEEELKAILHNQAVYYPFLQEEFTKICQIFSFRIPYYVGPLAKEKGGFAWLDRTSTEPIRPWNLNERVDLESSASGFIERMTNFDSYLPEEKVLPKHSLTYEKYMVFNELTKVNYIDERGKKQNFSQIEKLEIFEKLFKQKRKVTEKDLKNYLIDELGIEIIAIKGIENSFNANFGTYHDLKKTGIPASVLDASDNDIIFEEIIKILTVFEDRKMISKQLEKYSDIFGKKILKKLERRHYTGWGKLSYKLINGIRDRETNKTILDYLISDDGLPRNINRNFMQLINDDDLSFKEEIAKHKSFDPQKNINEVVQKLAGSPAIKKGILQSLKIVREIIDIMGYDPENIVVEMARENQTTAQGVRNSKPRYKYLEDSIADLGSSILKDYPIDNIGLQNDRLFLYYLQNGKDMYTGHDLDIDKLSNYDIDHIIPQSFIVDNSIDNKVLVSSAENRGNKGADVPDKNVVSARLSLWESLKKSKLISERKFNYLTKGLHGGLTPDDKAGFIKRQLVETRQITKNVAIILDQMYNSGKTDDAKKIKIITLKASLTSQFRKAFKLYKVREINDHHHAHDAYLNCVVATALLKFYPQLEPEFVYGEYRRFNSFEKNKATAKKEFYTNIMKKFYDGETYADDNGEIFWNQHAITKVRKVLNYHQVNIVKKTETQTGQFSKESVKPKGNSDKLIPRKTRDFVWDPAKYGGFDSPIVAYSIIISYTKGKKLVKKMVGIPISEQHKFEQNNQVFLTEKGYKNPKVLLKLYKYSLCEFENGRRRMIASGKELQKGNQMVLPAKLVTLLYFAKQLPNDLSGDSKKHLIEHRNEFSELLKRVVDFNNRYTLADNNIKKILALYEKHQSDAIEEIAESFVNLMQLNAMGAPVNFDFFGEAIPRKRYKSVNEVLSSVIINQSITGLYETRTKLGD